MTVSLRRARPRAPLTAPVAFHAPLFHDLVREMDAARRYVVLDLGAASTEMLTLLGRSRCRAEIADLAHFGGIERLNATEPGPALARAADSLVPRTPPGDAFDLVFCWDLPNYLTLNALSALMKAIGHHARNGALAHVLLCYAERDMHENPGRFVPTVDGELVDLSRERTSVPAPRYSPEDLGKSMGRFVLDRARLLSTGMQEFLFRL